MNKLFILTKKSFGSKRVNFGAFLATRNPVYHNESTANIRESINIDGLLGGSGRRTYHTSNVQENPNIHILSLRDKTKSKFISFEIDGNWSFEDSMEKILPNSNKAILQQERCSMSLMRILASKGNSLTEFVSFLADKRQKENPESPLSIETELINLINTDPEDVADAYEKEYSQFLEQKEKKNRRN